MGNSEKAIKELLNCFENKDLDYKDKLDALLT
jgi:hypothetical protein